MSQLAFEPAPGAPHLTVEAALDYFVNGAKSDAPTLIGVEMECFLVDYDTLELRSFKQVEEVFSSLADRYDWERICEGGRIVALSRAGAVLALEPGGQIEYASLPVATLAELLRDIKQVFGELRAVVSERGEDLLSLGLHPTAQIKEINLVPKERYTIMAPRLTKTGPLAIHMMKGSCAWQCALDYKSEADFAQKFKAAQHIVPFVSAIFANAPWEEGIAIGGGSRRLQAWLATDQDRCGLIRQVFEREYFGFEEYWDYACSVPMLFVIRDEKRRIFTKRIQGALCHNGRLATSSLHLVSRGTT